ncbi:protein S40-1-like [Gastrolobium bilobum]|uniref:protein S40-1-like n=1 Tax=Gastrolobium bilobum TaxID=150636 RepID=UPI002AAF0B38|nr:protein S40-1-like [Gastrolobium bilobum]
MADRSVFLNKSSCFGGEAREDKDFDEEDVRGVTKEREYDSCPKTKRAEESSSGPRKIPRANSNTLPASNATLIQGSSAPMDIPDWSKIYGKNCKKNKGGCGCSYADHCYDDGGDDENDDMIPPHEWIARKLARSHISSFSMCEGMGRTLKGRDLSKVRNAILTKTGFIE